MTNLEEEEGCMEVRNLSYICSTYADMASPIKPAGSVKDEIEIFLAITNGPGKENYVYPTGIFQSILWRESSHHPIWKIQVKAYLHSERFRLKFCRSTLRGFWLCCFSARGSI